MRGNFKIRRTKLHRDTSQERIDKIKEEYDKDNSNSKRSNSLKNRTFNVNTIKQYLTLIYLSPQSSLFILIYISVFKMCLGSDVPHKNTLITFLSR